MVVVVGAESEISTTEVVGAYNRRKRNNLVQQTTIVSTFR